jgi:hypothetical protein
MAALLEVFQHGEMEEDAQAWWDEFKSLSTIELSELSPFIRITPLIMINTDIVEHKVSSLLTMYKSQMKTDGYTGGYALKGMTMNVQDTVGATFEIVLEFQIFDLEVFEKSSDSGLYFLSNLNSRLKLEFGWGKYMWPLVEQSHATVVEKHAGKGQELYCAVVKANVGISDEQIITFTVTLRAPSSLLMKQWRNDFGFDLNMDAMKLPVAYFKRKKWMTWLTGARDVVSAVTLKTLTDHITRSIQTKLYKVGMNSQTPPTFDVRHPISKLQVLNPSLDPDIGLAEEGANATVGDILISTDYLKEAKISTKTSQLFMKEIIDKINSAGGGALKLDIIPSLNGSILTISNVASPTGKVKANGKVEEDIWSIRDRYLKLNFADGNSLVQSITFNSDIEAAATNVQNFIQKQGLEKASNPELLAFMSSWYEDTDTWKTATGDERMKLQLDFEKDPSNLFSQVLQLNKELENAEEMRAEFAAVVESLVVLDNTLKYLPYKMEVTIKGVSDMNKGTRILLDETVAIPIFRSTIWRIVDISHALDDSSWTTTFSAICEFNNEINKKNIELEDSGRKKFKQFGDKFDHVSKFI